MTTVPAVELPDTAVGEQEETRRRLAGADVALVNGAYFFMGQRHGRTVARARQLRLPTVDNLRRHGVVSGPLADVWRQLPGSLEGDEHRERRRRVAHLFSPGRAAALAPRTRATADSLLDGVVRQGGGDLSEDFATPLCAWAICTYLGIDVVHAPLIIEWSAALARCFYPMTPAQVQAAEAAVEALADFLEEVLAREDAEEGVLVELARDGALSAAAVQALAANVVFGGHDTTSKALVNGLFTLLRFPSQLDALRAGADAGVAVDEILRYEPSVAGVTRIADEAFELEGVRCPKGATVVVYGIVANRDPMVFEDPDEFIVTRGARGHLAFGGGGPHQCLGESLARMIMTEALRAFVAQPCTWRLAEPFDEIPWHDDGTFRGLARLPVSAEPMAESDRP